MNDKMKIIGACVLVLGGVGIWVPQMPGLLGGKKEAPARTPLPAEDEPIPGMPPQEESASVPEQAEDPESSPTAPPKDDPLSRIEALLLQEQEGKDDGLASLAMSWQGQREPEEMETSETSSSEVPEPGANLDPGLENPVPIPFGLGFGGFDSTLSEETSEKPERDPFEAFINEFPLSGLILGKKRQLASFGPYTLEVGDFIPSTNAKIVSIERRSVVVRRGDENFAISLPPFRSNPEVSEDAVLGTDADGDSETSATPSNPDSSMRSVDADNEAGDNQ